MIPAKPLSKKQIRSVNLLRKRSERSAVGQFVVEGERAVAQTLANGVLSVISVVLTHDFLKRLEAGLKKETTIKQDASDDRLHMFRREDIQLFTVSDSVFNQLTDTDSPQGVLAVCRIPNPVTEENILAGNGLLLAADQIQDPGNMGTMIRTAVWFGLSGLIVSPGTVDLYHPKVVRSTAGATGMLPWLETELPDFFEKARGMGWQIYLLDSGSGSLPYRAAEPAGKDVLVIGNEANGISGKLRDLGFTLIRIDPGSRFAGNSPVESGVPTIGYTGVESLNASVAASIIMAHFSRG